MKVGLSSGVTAPPSLAESLEKTVLPVPRSPSNASTFAALQVSPKACPRATCLVRYCD
jgi:hypothetical protein